MIEQSDLFPEPWKRLPDEGDRPFAAFRTYLDLGPQLRSLEKVRKALGSLTGKSRGMRTIELWSSRFRWRDRTQAWDAHLERVNRRSREKAVADEAALWEKRRHGAIHAVYQDAMALREKGREMLNHPISSESAGGRVVKPARWSFAVAIHALRTAAEMEALACEAADPQPSDKTPPEILRAIECAVFAGPQSDGDRGRRDEGEMPSATDECPD